MQSRVSSLLVLLVLGAAAVLAMTATGAAAADVQADVAAVAAVADAAEDHAFEEAEAELDAEEGIDADDEAEDEADDEAEEAEDASFLALDSPAAVAPKKQKKAKRALPVRARYYGQKKSAGPAQYSLPEYGDPNPKKTAAAAAKAAKRGTPVHPRVFTANYLSPLPASHPRVKCYGRGKREKCYRVDRAGRVLGRHAHRPLPRVVAETRSLHAMEKKGFQTAEYDDKLAQWKPRKHKRTLSPAPVISLLQVDAEDDSENEAEAEAEDDSEAEAESESESESEAEFVPANVVRKGCPKAQACPVCITPKATFGRSRTRKGADAFARAHASDDAEADMTVRDRLRPAFLAGVQFADDAVAFQLKVDALQRKTQLKLLDAVRAHKPIPKGCPLLPRALDCPCRPPLAVAPIPETSRAALAYAVKLGDADLSYRWSMREASRDAFLAGVKYADDTRLARQTKNDAADKAAAAKSKAAL